MLMAEANSVEDNDSVDQVLVSIVLSLSTDGLCGNDIGESPTTHYALTTLTRGGRLLQAYSDR